MTTPESFASPTPTALTCPACGAALDLGELQRGDGSHLECTYCGSAVALPESTKHADRGIPSPVWSPVGPGGPDLDGRPIRRSRGWLILVVVLLLAVVLVGGGLWRAKLLPGSGNGFAQVVLEFGGKGTGPGLMDDPRLITVDGDGNIWTADYQDGRLLEFDPAGKFVRVVRIPRPASGVTYVSALAADAKGHVYLARGGDILVFATATGTVQRTIAGSPAGLTFDDVAVDANGALYGLQSMATANTVVAFDAAGRVAHRWDNPVAAVDPEVPGMELRLAVDGLGQFDIVSFFADQVYRYDADGRFIDRFGSKGDQPGQLNSPKAIAVDGQSRIYVMQFLGAIDQFDPSGRFLGRIAVDYGNGTPMGMTMDRAGFVYVVTNASKVMKYQLTSGPTATG